MFSVTSRMNDSHSTLAIKTNTGHLCTTRLPLRESLDQVAIRRPRSKASLYRQTSSKVFWLREEAHGIPGPCAILRGCILLPHLHLQYCEVRSFLPNIEYLALLHDMYPVSNCIPGKTVPLNFIAVSLLSGVGRISESTTPRPNGV